MKHKTAELEGALLDAAVAKAEGQDVVSRGGLYWIEWPSCSEDAQVDDFDWETRKGYDCYQPSEDWHLGGPIVERERMSLSDPDTCDANEWQAKVWGTLITREQGGNDMAVGHGQTPLVAAMRAYVMSKFGEEVELP